MAIPAESLEATAAAIAEWFIVDHFTRDGSGDGSDGRSFVEWAGTLERVWVDSATLELTVVVRRLAAPGDEPYRRLPTEAWRVTTELSDEGWAITDGPEAVSVPEHDVQVETELDWEDPAGLTWSVARSTGQ